jgi:hypothetical protein
MEIRTIGSDLGKTVFQLCRVNDALEWARNCVPSIVTVLTMAVLVADQHSRVNAKTNKKSSLLD